MLASCDRCGKLLSTAFPLHECDHSSCAECGQVYHKVRNPQFRAGCKTCDRRYRALRKKRALFLAKH